MSPSVKLIDVKTDDMTDYKKTSILLVFPCCFKCCLGCQNQHLRDSRTKDYDIDSIINLYNRLSEHTAIVCAGLDPFDSFEDVKKLITAFSNNSKDVDFVVYTGYTYEELDIKVRNELVPLTGNNLHLIVKYGRYDKDNKDSYFSDTLGVELAGDNQVVMSY